MSNGTKCAVLCLAVCACRFGMGPVTLSQLHYSPMEDEALYGPPCAGASSVEVVDAREDHAAIGHRFVEGDESTSYPIGLEADPSEWMSRGLVHAFARANVPDNQPGRAKE